MAVGRKAHAPSSRSVVVPAAHDYPRPSTNPLRGAATDPANGTQHTPIGHRLFAFAREQSLSLSNIRKFQEIPKTCEPRVVKLMTNQLCE
jgi:hypothetical protein